MRLCKTLLLTGVSSLLVACGGGGGSSGSSSTPTPPPPPPPTNSAPTLTTNPADLTFNENEDFSFDIIVSDADGDDVTVTVDLSGDGQFFGLNADSGIVESLEPFDFENPLDSNGDNVYEATVTLDDGTVTVTETVSVTIENVAEPVVVTSLASTQSFDIRLLGTAGDIDGDGVNDLIFSNGSIFEGVEPFGIISGAEYTNILQTGGRLDGNTPTLSIFDFGNTDIGNFNVDVLEAPDGSGVDLLFADFNTAQIYEYRVRTDADRQNLLGTIDLTAPASNRIVYDLNVDPDVFFAGRHVFVGDVDGNGFNDILFEYYEASGQTDPIVGLIFTDPITDGSSQTVTVAADVSLEALSILQIGVTGGPLSDIDLDGRDDVLFRSDRFNCVLFSSHLTDPSVTSVVVDDLDPSEGICLPVENRILGTLDLDHDSDGSNVLVINDFPGEFLFDADDFRALPASSTREEILAGGAKIIATEVDQVDGTPIFALSDLTPVSDLTGDGVVDYVAANLFIGSGILNPPFYFVDGVIVSDALNSSESIFDASDQGLIPIALESFSFSDTIVESLNDEFILLRGNDLVIALAIETLQAGLDFNDGAGFIIVTE